MNCLVVDDEANVLETISLSLETIGHEAIRCASPLEALDVARDLDRRIDLALIDLKMRPIDGIDLMRRLLLLRPGLVPIIVTAHGTVASAVAAIKRGAFDYIQKPFDLAALQDVVDRAATFVRQQENVARPDRPEIISTEPAMLEKIGLARRVGASPLNVIVQGESGTGKELIASLIHAESDRREQPFVTINCAALPEHLLESELFGHVKGAFTGAVSDRAGRFEVADGGTLFLDEIGEMAPALQASLLRAIQQGEFEPVGDSKTRRVDVRIVAATNRRLSEEIVDGSFREDLYYRLNGVTIELPPLRDRPNDILALTEHFIARYSEGRESSIELGSGVLESFRRYRWPGNVRELENVLARLVYLSSGSRVDIDDLPDEIRLAFEAGVVDRNEAGGESLVDIEREHIRRMIEESESYDEAARRLGIDPATLWRKRKKYGL